MTSSFHRGAKCETDEQNVGELSKMCVLRSSLQKCSIKKAGTIYYGKFFKNTNFEEDLQMAASEC